ncbi:MAG TPA: hypothetical protein DGT21_10435 [Armatimonadetes bacterium]|nr:hypothetical protein [Armatimonadota bacterium]
MAYSFLDLAYEVLKESDKPLTYQEIWDTASNASLTAKLKTSGKTPWASLGSRLYVDIRETPDSRFVGVGKRPMRFFLAERKAELPQDAALRIEAEEAKKPDKAPHYLERDLHPLLTYHCYANPAFNRGRSIYSKTIRHQKSQKPGYSEWVYPDMVGFYLPLDDWTPDVIEFNRLSDNNSLRLFSFEIKRSLTKANYREAYFQAVSNSSWAHEGYLVAAQVVQDDELLTELDRLASSFGIGILHLDPVDLGGSSIIYPARVRGDLDWETINKLCEQNPDFAKFLQDVKIDFESKRIHRAEYDDIIQDPEKYVVEKLKA